MFGKLGTDSRQLPSPPDPVAAHAAAAAVEARNQYCRRRRRRAPRFRRRRRRRRDVEAAATPAPTRRLRTSVLLIGVDARSGVAEGRPALLKFRSAGETAATC